MKRVLTLSKLIIPTAFIVSSLLTYILAMEEMEKIQQRLIKIRSSNFLLPKPLPREFRNLGEKMNLDHIFCPLSFYSHLHYMGFHRKKFLIIKQNLTDYYPLNKVEIVDHGPFKYFRDDEILLMNWLGETVKKVLIEEIELSGKKKLVLNYYGELLSPDFCDKYGLENFKKIYHSLDLYKIP